MLSDDDLDGLQKKYPGLASYTVVFPRNRPRLHPTKIYDGRDEVKWLNDRVQEIMEYWES